MSEHQIQRYFVDVETIEDGDFRTSQTWYVYDVSRDAHIIHNEFGPAIIRYEPYSGNVIEERWYDMGQANRVDGPAVVKYDPIHNTVVEELYIVNGRKHRLDGPAHIVWDGETGELFSEKHFRWGEPHKPKSILSDDLDL